MKRCNPLIIFINSLPYFDSMGQEIARGSAARAGDRTDKSIRQSFDSIRDVADLPKAQRTPTDRNNYRVFTWTDEDGRVVAECRDLQGVVTDGENMDSALTNATEAISAYLESEGEAWIGR